MPYDPNLPQNGQPLDADALRQQLQGIVELISSIPQGEPGPPGQTGSDGSPGGPGPAGPPFAQAVVDAVNTVDAGQNAQVSVSFDGTNVRFIFDIPRGSEGVAGSPGEVTLEQMKGLTSANTDAVSTLDDAFSDPPTQADMETLRAKLNELILALRQI